jgi:hypothetical protein
MSQKLVRFGALRGTRSRQDESKEVHEAGRIRPSSGCNGVHVRWWIGLICLRLVGGKRRENERGAHTNEGEEATRSIRQPRRSPEKAEKKTAHGTAKERNEEDN